MKKYFRPVALALLLVLGVGGVQPLTAAYWQWSKTAATNATADPSINWAEGMSPSSINDSARAMMARSAEERDDTSGLLSTAGGPIAFTVATNQGIKTPVPTDGQLLTVTMNATNGIASTLAADGGTAFPIMSAPGAPVPAGTLILGSPYALNFSVANSAWMLHGFFGSSLNVPLGAMLPYTLMTVPNSNYVFPAGQCLSTTTYAAYWVALGSPGNGTCSSGQFKIIDASGSVVAGLDTMPGFSAASRLTSATGGCGTAMTTVGARCANGIEGSPVTAATMQAIGVGVSVSVSGSVSGGTSLVVVGSGSGNGAVSGVGFPLGNATIAGSFSGSGSGSGSSTNTLGQNRPNVPPIVGVTYLLRVL